MVMMKFYRLHSFHMNWFWFMIFDLIWCVIWIYSDRVRSQSKRIFSLCVYQTAIDGHLRHIFRTHQLACYNAERSTAFIWMMNFVVVVVENVTCHAWLACYCCSTDVALLFLRRFSREATNTLSALIGRLAIIFNFTSEWWPLRHFGCVFFWVLGCWVYGKSIFAQIRG